MNSQSIIKWRLVWMNIWIIGIAYLVIYIAEDQLFGTQYSAWLWGAFLILFGIYNYWKVGVWQYLVLCLVLGTGSWHYEAAQYMDTFLSSTTVYIHLVLLIVAFMTTMPTIIKAFKLELHARKLFLLAAQQVADVSNGFTNRPYSAGKVKYEKQVILGLARYMAGKEILMYHAGSNLITFAFSMNTSPLVDPQMNRVSYVSIDQSGNLSVHISERDYRQYKSKLSFDQLNNSFASMFKQFLEYYENGNEERILTELKSV